MGTVTNLPHLYEDCPDCGSAVVGLTVVTTPGREWRPNPYTVVTEPDEVIHFVLIPCGHTVECQAFWMDEDDVVGLFWRHGYHPASWPS